MLLNQFSFHNKDLLIDIISTPLFFNKNEDKINIVKANGTFFIEIENKEKQISTYKLIHTNNPKLLKKKEIMETDFIFQNIQNKEEYIYSNTYIYNKKEIIKTDKQNFRNYFSDLNKTKIEVFLLDISEIF